MTNFIAVTDLHGVEHDPTAVAAFKRAVALLDPNRKHTRLFLGDLWNFAAIRRGADEDEKSIRLQEDFKAGLDFLDWYRPSILLLGNHDQRLWDCVKRERVRKSGWLAELASLYVGEFEAAAKKMKIRVFPYDKRKGVCRLGGVAFAHGFGHGETLTRRMADAYGTSVFGHGHKIVRNSVIKGGRGVTAYQIGCLCRDMEYTRSDLSALRQQHGFAYGSLDGPRSTIIQAEIIGGKTVVAPILKVV